MIGNALKFTGKGSISVNCKVINDSSAFQEICISISDTGIGMERSFIDNIFRKFSQEDKAVTRKFGGTGLGMAITKELVQLMNGKIEIESEKNKGTSIHIYLNFQKGNAENLKNLTTGKNTATLDNISILLVEDNDLNRMVAQNFLQYFNCKVTEAESGLEALEILKKQNFDIILMDIQMPQMDGIEAAKIIRNEFKLSTPIIALTANAFKTENEKCRKAGMNDYVTKPFDEDILVETIAKHTPNKTIAISNPGNENIANYKLYSLNTLHNLSRGNLEFVNKMLTIFVEQTTATLQKAEKAISMGDFIEASRLIHKIKPSVESLGVTSIMGDIKSLEKIAKETQNKEQIVFLFKSINTILQKVVLQLKENELKQ